MAKLETVDFDYARESTLRRRLKANLRDLARSAEKVEAFRNELIKNCDGKKYDELQEEFDYQPVLLGGVEEGEYTDNSLAGVYKDIFGLQPESVTDLQNRLQIDTELNVEIQVNETRFSTFISQILDELNSIFEEWEKQDLGNISDVKPEVEFYDTLSDPDKLMRLLSDFIHNLEGVLPNYNNAALFIWTLDTVPRGYLERAYPKLKDSEEAWGTLEKFGLQPVFVPETEDEGLQESYTIYAYGENSIGDKLTGLYRHIWSAFDYDVGRHNEDNLRHDLSQVFTELVPNFKSDFVYSCRESIDELSEGESYESEELSNIHIVDTKDYGKDDIPVRAEKCIQAEYVIDGLILPKCHYTTFKWEVKDRDETDRRKKEEDCNIPLTRFLDKISPLLFLLHGLEYELEISEELDSGIGKDSFEIRRIDEL